jgi:hypothetical protein
MSQPYPSRPNQYRWDAENLHDVRPGGRLQTVGGNDCHNLMSVGEPSARRVRKYRDSTQPKHNRDPPFQRDNRDASRAGQSWTQS